MNAQVGTEHRRRALLLSAFVALTPAAAYFLIVMIGILFGITGPARWLVEDILTTGNSVLALLAIVFGGPVLSVVIILTARLGHGPARGIAGVCGGAAALLILCNALFGVFALPFSLFLD